MARELQPPAPARAHGKTALSTASREVRRLNYIAQWRGEYGHAGHAGGCAGDSAERAHRDTNLDNNLNAKLTPPTRRPKRHVHYEIVWRDSGDRLAVSAECCKVWLHGAGEATLPVSKDKVFFGVRALQRSGQCSQE